MSWRVALNEMGGVGHCHTMPGIQCKDLGCYPCSLV